MFRTLIKLAIGLLIINGVWRTGLAYYQYYEFQDALQHTAQFAAGKTVASTQASVMEIARSLDVPLQEERVNVRKDQNRIFIDAIYTRPIEVVPMYPVRWEFTVKVSAMQLGRLK